MHKIRTDKDIAIFNLIFFFFEKPKNLGKIHKPVLKGDLKEHEKKKKHFSPLGTMHRGFLFILFCKLQQRYFDLYVKNKFLKSYIPGPSFFSWNLFLILYVEKLVVFFLCLVMYKLNLKPGSFCSVLGLATNQKKFKHT